LTSPRPTHPANCLRSPPVQQPLFSVATLCGPTPSADAKGDWLRVREVPVPFGRSLLLTLFDRPQNAQTAIWPRLNSRPNRHLCQTGPLLLNNPFSHSHPRPTSHPLPPPSVQQPRRLPPSHFPPFRPTTFPPSHLPAFQLGFLPDPPMFFTSLLPQSRAAAKLRSHHRGTDHRPLDHSPRHVLILKPLGPASRPSHPIRELCHVASV